MRASLALLVGVCQRAISGVLVFKHSSKSDRTCATPLR